MNGWYEIEFRETEANVAAVFNLDELVQMRLQRKRRSGMRANAKTAKSVAPKAQAQRWIGFSEDDVKNLAPKAHYLDQRVEDNAFHLQAHHLAHVFHGRAAVGEHLVVVFLEIELVAELLLFAQLRRSRCSVTPTK